MLEKVQAGYKEAAVEFNKDISQLIERIGYLEQENKNLKIELENKGSEIQNIKDEKERFIEEEKNKSKNYINLIKELEKKKVNIDSNNESIKLKEQLEELTQKMKDIEVKYKIKLEQKDKIIKHLDDKLSEYEIND
jgi:chromosome segregation ATPase